MKSERMAKRASFGNIVLKKLSDITNLQNVKVTSHEEKPPEMSEIEKNHVDQLVKVQSWFRLYAYVCVCVCQKNKLFFFVFLFWGCLMGFCGFGFLNQERRNLMKLIAERKYPLTLWFFS